MEANQDLISVMNKSFFLREFQDTKGVKRIRRSKDEQHNGKKGQKYKQ
jgi:hypothetical protein